MKESDVMGVVEGAASPVQESRLKSTFSLKFLRTESNGC